MLALCYYLKERKEKNLLNKYNTEKNFARKEIKEFEQFKNHLV